MHRIRNRGTQNWKASSGVQRFGDEPESAVGTLRGLGVQAELQNVHRATKHPVTRAAPVNMYVDRDALGGDWSFVLDAR